MKRSFVIALGTIWSWAKSNNRDELIGYVKDLDISGVELSLGSKDILNSFKLSDENREWLRKLPYLSIHAPCMKEGDENEIIPQLELVSQLYSDLGASNVIFHPDSLPSRDILRRYRFNASIENLPRTFGIGRDKLGQILEEYPEMGFCLDVAHSYSWSKDETEILLNEFKDKITQIHFSGVYNNKDHSSIRDVGRDFLESLKPIRKMEHPIVIEEDLKIRSINYLREEIELVRDYFN